jgi:hypothetical protein
MLVGTLRAALFTGILLMPSAHAAFIGNSQGEPNFHKAQFDSLTRSSITPPFSSVQTRHCRTARAITPRAFQTTQGIIPVRQQMTARLFLWVTGVVLFCSL